MIVYNMIMVHLVLFFLGLFKKNSKLLFFLQLLWMYFLAAGDTASADFGVNEQIYDTADINGEYVTIYDSMCCVGKYLGLDVIEFNAILLIPVFIVLWKIIIINTENCSFVGGLILLYPFVDMVTQKRWLFSSIISLLGLLVIIKKIKYSKSIFVILITIASFIHAAALGYIIFIIVDWFCKTKKKLVYLSLIILIAMIFSTIAPYFLGLIPMIGEDRAELYFIILHAKMNNPILTFIAFSIIHIMFVICVYLFYKIAKQYNFYNILQLDSRRLLSINLISFVMIPLYYWEPTFFRIYRNIIILNYIFIASCLPINNIYLLSIMKKVILFIIFFLGLISFTFFIAYNNFENVVLSIFVGNILAR